MTTTLKELVDDKYDMVLEIYDTISWTEGCKIFIHPKGEDSGLKFNVTDEVARQIVIAFQSCRFLHEGEWGTL
jgi:hypothetical protein